MKRLVLLILFSVLSHAQKTKTNFFISPGSQADQLESGNNTADYPIYQEGDLTLFSWNTNWSIISLLLYQNENASFIRLLDFVENPPNSMTYNMTPPVDLTWNDVFFLTLWNENWVNEGGERFFSSSYFKINASSTSTTTATTSTTSPTPSPTDSSDSSPGSNPDSSPTPNPTSDPSSKSSGLTSSAKVGLGVGLGLGIPLLALAGVAAFFYLRKKRATAAGGMSAGMGGKPLPHPPPGFEYHQAPSSPPVSDLANPSPFKLGYSEPFEAEGSSPAHMMSNSTGVQELPADRR